MCLEINFLHEFSFLDRFGQSGLQGEKNPTCHKYATFQATITCFHYNGAFTVASFILISILLNFSFLYVLVFLKNARTSPLQCNPDLVTSYLVTNPDLVTILQKTIFLVHKNISFSDNLVFSAPSI